MRSLVAAIEEKYGSQLQHEDHEAESWVIYVPKPKTKPGEEDCVKVPTRLTMEDYSISEAGNPDKLREICGGVHELDLTKNCLTDWKEVVSILENLPEMCFLNLTRNNLVDSTLVQGSRSFPRLNNLVLNGTGVSWKILASLIAWFPSLKELHLSLMDYTSVDLPKSLTHNSLRKLYLNECNISEWAEISKLGHAFPCLEYLNLIKINVKILSDSDQYSEFSALESLNISETELESWEEIDKFRRFPSLTHVKLADLSFLKSWDAKQRRQHIIARLPNITLLNASPIYETEREDAERAFIRYYMDQEGPHPARYEELEAKHGKLERLVELDLKPIDYYKLCVKFEEKQEIMDIPSRMSIAELKKMLQTFTGLPPAQFHLYVNRVVRGEQLGTSLAKPLTKQVYTFNFADDDMFEVVRKDEPARVDIRISYK